MNGRITRTLHDLGRYLPAYSRTLDEIAKAGSPLRSPSGVGITTAMIDEEEYGVRIRPTNPPESRPPSRSDGRMRVALIVSVRNIAESIRMLAPLFDDVTAWEPIRLAHTTPLITDGGRVMVELIRCTPDGKIDWRDADDDLTPLLSADEVARGVQQLRGLLGALQGQWEDIDEVDRDIIEDALALADIAVDTLQRGGIWDVPIQPPPPPRCAEDGCDTVPEWGRKTFRERCSKHRRTKDKRREPSTPSSTAVVSP